MSEYTVLPLLNSAFKPGTAVEVVERFEDSDFRNIARAELNITVRQSRQSGVARATCPD